MANTAEFAVHLRRNVEKDVVNRFISVVCCRAMVQNVCTQQLIICSEIRPK